MLPAKDAIMSCDEELIRLLPPCLHWHPDGEIRLAGHRIGLYHFILYYNQGYTAEMLQCQFPTLELALIHKIVVFYIEHKNTVDDYVARYQADLDQLRAAGIHAPSVAELRKRLDSRRRDEAVGAQRV
jgi:hypothetical protein